MARYGVKLGPGYQNLGKNTVLEVFGYMFWVSKSEIYLDIYSCNRTTPHHGQTYAKYFWEKHGKTKHTTEFDDCAWHPPNRLFSAGLWDAASNWSMVRKNHSTNQVIKNILPNDFQYYEVQDVQVHISTCFVRFARFFKDYFPATVATIDSVQHAQTLQSKISISFASRVEPANSNHRNHSQPLLGAGFQIRHQVNSDRALGC